jgi:hypothetical protein
MRRYIPLREATEIAHERTAGTAYAGMAEREAQNYSDQDSINRWFAWSIWHRVPIYGAVAPGKTIVRIPAEYQACRHTRDLARDGFEMAFEQCEISPRLIGLLQREDVLI